MNYAPALPHMDPERPDSLSAVFHLVHAAACGMLAATQSLLTLCRGLSPELLPELSFAEERAGHARTLRALAAWQGDAFAAMEVAAEALSVPEEGLHRGGDLDQAAAVLQRALRLKAATPGGGADGSSVREGGVLEVPSYDLGARLGEVLSALNRWEAAAAAFDEAAESAMNLSKGKLSFKLSEKAEDARSKAAAAAAGAAPGEADELSSETTPV